MTGVSNPFEDVTDLKESIKAAAEKLGFCLCGFTTAEPLSDFERYTRWLDEDCIGTMAFLKRSDHIVKRSDPHMLLPDVCSICVLAVPMGLQPDCPGASVASYAYYADYHDTITAMAEDLLKQIRQHFRGDFSYRVCVDAAPILERSLAVRAGLGWIGKSSMFISPRCGSALFLCEILLSLDIEPDAPYTKDNCGSCRRCVDACPNGCIDPETRTIRADRCAAYLTIEHKGDFTEEQSRLVGTHLFGCDECLKVCPWNARNDGSSPLPPADAIPSIADGDLSESEFREKFQKTPIQRTKARGLRRNADAVRENLKNRDPGTFQ